MNTALNSVVSRVIQAIENRSQSARKAYLDLMASSVVPVGSRKNAMGCGNLAHVCAALTGQEKGAMLAEQAVHLGIITSYNDMLSAHAPYDVFPAIIKAEAVKYNSTVQVASGVPAMCDGVTQGQDGMDLSLFSRDVIALSTAVGLSHNAFDGVFYLGICDKIVPGLLMGAARFGFLPALFIPSGPMTSGQDNSTKAIVRKQYAEGKATREDLLVSEMASYHGRGTCTFYGTANTNQIMLEAMGLQLSGSSFVPVDTPLRQAYTAEGVKALVEASRQIRSLYKVVDARNIVNAMVAIVATGGSTNHTLHIPAIAKAFGYTVTWDDFHALSGVTPLLAKLYPNGKADVNHFHAAGGIGFVLKTLSDGGFLAMDALHTAGGVLSDHLYEGELGSSAELVLKPALSVSLDETILKPADNPFEKEGGLICIQGNLGRAIVKQSAVSPDHRTITAPIRIFWSQEDVVQAYNRNELFRDMIVVLLGQGPAVKGMPELHRLMPYLVSAQDQGYKIALFTDGRLSGASGKVLSAIHCSPEYPHNQALQNLRDGQIVTIDCFKGILTVDENSPSLPDSTGHIPQPQTCIGLGREMFNIFRHNVTPAEQGATSIL